MLGLQTKGQASLQGAVQTGACGAGYREDTDSCNPAHSLTAPLGSLDETCCMLPAAVMPSSNVAARHVTPSQSTKHMQSRRGAHALRPVHIKGTAGSCCRAPKQDGCSACTAGLVRHQPFKALQHPHAQPVDSNFAMGQQPKGSQPPAADLGLPGFNVLLITCLQRVDARDHQHVAGQCALLRDAAQSPTEQAQHAPGQCNLYLSSLLWCPVMSAQ